MPEVVKVPEGSRRAVAAFYTLAVALSWAVWAPWVASVNGVGAVPSSSSSSSSSSWPYLHLVGTLGPCVAALIVLAWTGGRDRLRQLARATVTRRSAAVTIVFALLLPTMIFVASALIMARLNHRALRWDRIGVVREYPDLGPATYIAASLFFYGFGEEVGWRGFLYPALRRRHRPLTASLLVVPFWAAWHLPLFFATESYRAMGLGGAAGWLISLVSGSLLTAWLYDRANGSVLPAAVLHALLDVYFLADVGVPVQSAMGMAVTVWGVGVAVMLWRGGRKTGPTVLGRVGRWE